MDGAIDQAWNQESLKDGLPNSFLFLCARITNECRRTQSPSQCALNQSMSEGPLDPAHDAVTEVFCDVDGRHLVQVGITDFFGDLLSPSYAVVLAIDHELISVGRAFRQHLRLIVEKSSMLKMNGQRQRKQHQAARRREVVDHLECAALIEDMLRRSVVGSEAIPANMSFIHRSGTVVTKPSFRISNMFGPTERSSVPSSAVLILDP
jgi:hypothetical protein